MSPDSRGPASPGRGCRGDTHRTLGGAASCAACTDHPGPRCSCARPSRCSCSPPRRAPAGVRHLSPDLLGPGPQASAPIPRSAPGQTLMSTASPSPSQGTSRLTGPTAQHSCPLLPPHRPRAVIQGHGAGLHPGAGMRGQPHLAEALDQRALLGTQPGAVAVGHGQVHLPTVAPDCGGMCGHPVRKQPGGRVC